MKLDSKQRYLKILIDGGAFEGVKRIAHKVSSDIDKVVGFAPEITSDTSNLSDCAIFAATIGKSTVLDELVKNGKFDTSDIDGKREVYKVKLVKEPFPNVSEALVICGSDKRGTIYGLFSLSEYIGVSPLHYWGDAEPVKRNVVEICDDIETLSKEPSVKYRGFFINDEWPCFGSWAHGKFGGVNAEMYDCVFELLLRLKGNYMWPAMWASSFPLDGPGSLNEELADIYGVVMGASHHEPCLRASEEWDKVRGVDSPYGNEWNYYTNRDGLLKYWEDSLKRSGKYEHIITIGMRGERDSSMLGPNASLAENINLLKDIIKEQRSLIKKHVNEDIDKVPQLLALYKEVEEYFYGGENAPGLKDWEELDGVTCMLCEDNYGFMRTLPTEEIRNRKGGFGMYYHFDYHGGPVSYEWMPSTPYSKVWEQMSMAYDYGIRDIWIVNVGDLKFNEVPLTYFMALAYDFERWGTNSPNSTGAFVRESLAGMFSAVNCEIREKMAYVLDGYININSKRRPEALNYGIYHPCNYLEADRMLKTADELEHVNEEVYSVLDAQCKNAYYSMIYFPAKSSINLLRMHIYAGKNMHYAKQGKPAANGFARLVTECIEEDRRLSAEFGAFKDGKWKGMELEQHIGFVKWNDDNYRYPLRIQVEPAHKPRMTVSRKDSEQIASKTYGPPMIIHADDFLYEGNTEVILEIANDGIGEIEYRIEAEGRIPEWLTVSPLSGCVQSQTEAVLTCDRTKLPKETETIRLLIKDSETTVAVEVKGASVDTSGLPQGTFLQNCGVIAMEANHYYDMSETQKGRFSELVNYGRSGSGMKVYPTTADFTGAEDRPTLKYRFLIEEEGPYIAEVWTTPTNSVVNKRPLRFMLNNNVMESIPSTFRAGNPGAPDWCAGVLNQIRVTKTEFYFEKGVCELELSALEAGLVVERILVYKEGCLKPSYLGPLESFRKV